MRKVAEEAAIATASLRRAFPTQDALRQFCLEQIVHSVSTRIRAVAGDPRQRALRSMTELLPLDAARRTELIVQLQLSRLALTDESLRKNANNLHNGVRAVCRTVLEHLAEAGLLSATLDLSLETTRLHALLDGLALHLLWNVPDNPALHADQVLTRHLDSLAA